MIKFRRLKWYLLGAIFFLSVAEFVLTVFVGLTHRPLYQTHPRIEYLLKPQQNITRFGNHYFVNQYSMRSPEFPPDYYDQNKLRVLVLGDSIVNAGTRLDQSEIATSILQRQLTGQGYNAFVGNVSAGSWGPENIVAYIKEFGLFQAEVVILVISSHDAFDVPTFEALNQSTHPTERVYSSLLLLMRKYLNPISSPKPSFLAQQKRSSIKQQQENSQLTELMVLLKKSTDIFIVVKHDSHSELNEIDKNEEEIIIDNSCLKVKTICINTKDRFKKIQHTKQLYLDNLHLNKDGQHVLASVIYKQIIEQLKQ